MKVLGIIPARGGSKGIPRKNIKELNGLPLIAYTIQQALDARFLSRTIVSTDDEEIAAVAQYYHADVPFKRPQYLAQDQTSSIDVVINVLEQIQEQGEFYDAVCLLQPTSPYRPKGVIDNSIQVFIEKNADSLISVRKVPHHYNPHWVFENNENGFLRSSVSDQKIISRRQELPDTFHRDGAIYITKTDILRKEKTFFGTKIIGYEIDSPELINIDNLDDWTRAERFLK